MNRETSVMVTENSVRFTQNNLFEVRLLSHGLWIHRLIGQPHKERSILVRVPPHLQESHKMTLMYVKKCLREMDRRELLKVLNGGETVYAHV